MEREIGFIRARSKILFGAQYRLEVIAAIYAGSAFTLTDLSRQLGIPPSVSSVQKELKMLVAAGMLTEQPKVGGMRELYYVSNASGLWEVAREILAGFRVGEPLNVEASV